MLPYHWPHPTWNAVDHRIQPGQYASASKSQSQIWRNKPCCSEFKGVLLQLLGRLDQLNAQVNSLLNHIDGNSRSNVERGAKTSFSSSLTLVAVSTNRKRKTEESEAKAVTASVSSKCSTSVKRKKLIENLEQKVAEERADNERMEVRIAQMREQLASLRNKRQQMERDRIYRDLDKNSDAGDVDTGADSVDEYESEIDENLPKRVEKVTTEENLSTTNEN